ncbi:MAG: hypothetical protein IKU37_08745 [Candidatus Gastranaerophilales bacterium]|nr:hypothetical protein [Candidatus Gastranaerophilales bacterium]
MKILEEMFNLNTVITEIQKATKSAYNFEATHKELETNIHIFSAVEIPLEIQQRYAKFNADVKKLANEMIEELIIKRDDLTLKLLQQQAHDNSISSPCEKPEEESEQE